MKISILPCDVIFQNYHFEKLNSFFEEELKLEKNDYNTLHFIDFNFDDKYIEFMPYNFQGGFPQSILDKVFSDGYNELIINLSENTVILHSNAFKDFSNLSAAITLNNHQEYLYGDFLILKASNDSYKGLTRMEALKTLNKINPSPAFTKFIFYPCV